MWQTQQKQTVYGMSKNDAHELKAAPRCSEFVFFNVNQVINIKHNNIKLYIETNGVGVHRLSKDDWKSQLYRVVINYEHKSNVAHDAFFARKHMIQSFLQEIIVQGRIS